MKSSVLVIFLLMFNHASFPQTKHINSIEIAYVDCTTETVFDIPYSLFDRQFQGEKKHSQVKESEIAKFKETMKKFVITKSNGFDARGKITFILNGRLKNYWFACSGAFTDGMSFYMNTPLFEILKKELGI